MAIFINDGDVTNPNNVGQFGATEESIGAYKQAGEYAQDAEYWAKLAEHGYNNIDELLKVVEELLAQGVLLAKDIEDLKRDFAAQDERLTQLISQTQAAVDSANNAIILMDQKIAEVQAQLDILQNMYVTVETLPPTTPATGTYDPTTGELHLGIPQGAPGSVTDLDDAPIGVPDVDDWGFYVESTDNIVHKALMSDIAKTFPSVTSVAVGTGSPEQGDVTVTAAKLGLGNVLNVPSYSKTESDTKSKGFVKTYQTKALADADAANRIVGEVVLVWNDYTYDFYTVVAGASGQPNTLSASTTKSEKRIVTVNLKEPDASGNIDVTIPTGNPSLYLGEMLLFPYDPNKPVTYAGIQPADGRLISKANAEDLGPSLVTGQLPVVSETEWQAGAKHYFSWGKLADGTTDADSTNYINIRLPDWTDGTAMRSPSSTGDTSYAGQEQVQIPYITMVNGVAPADADGKVVIPFSSFTDAILSNNVALQAKDAAGYAKDLVKVSTDGKVVVGDSSIPTVITGTTVSVSDGTNTGKVYSEINKPTLADLNAAERGVNDSITSMTGLTSITSKVNFTQGASGIDPASASDYATKRYVDNNSGGGSGATLNGIMNYGVGKPLMHASRAFIPAYELPLDGQLVSRTAYPDLWAWAQATTPIADTAWVATASERGKYSLGDGSTTFRLPDWNGVQRNGVNGFTGPDSIPGVFFRGGTGAEDMVMALNASPDILGTFASDNQGTAWTAATAGTGAFKPASPQINNIFHPLSGYDKYTGNGTWEFKASYSNAAYGRNGTGEVVPNKVSGVWVVRASGGFTAANTSWSVINADATAPGNNTTVYGGLVRSVYKVGTEEYANADLAASLNTDSSGVKTAGAEVRVVNNTTGTPVIRTIKLGTVDGLTGGTITNDVTVVGGVWSDQGMVVQSRQNGDGSWPLTSPAHMCLLRGRVPNAGQPGGWWGMNMTENVNVDCYGSLYLQAAGVNRAWLFNQAGNAISPGAWTPNSDARLKRDKVYIQDPLEKMKKMRGYTWTRIDSEAWGIGFLAQEVLDVFPEAVSAGPDRKLPDGTTVEGVLSPDTYGVAAGLHHEAILALMDKIEILEARIAQLESK